MTIANSAKELPTFDGRVAFVPTMGALHAGHMSLVEAAKKVADKVVVSIFVNPTQFGPNEDFNRYPRTFEADAELCKKAGVDVIYAPSVEEIYPTGFDTSIRVGEHEHILDGKFRPGHFTGVATVVTKLFNLVRPDVALFGEKDFQQLTLIKQLVRDLNMPIEIIGVPTLREPDGLALSSRNRYLNPQERAIAAGMYATLNQLAAGIKAKKITPAEVPARGAEMLINAGFTKVDYVEYAFSPARLLAAAWLGTTRLIDNIAV